MRTNRFWVMFVSLVSAMTLACGGTETGGDGGDAHQPGYSISGSVTGAVVTGLTVNLTGAASATATTDSQGNFRFSGLSNGAYLLAVSPSEGYSFSPFQLEVTLDGADVADLSFTSIAVVEVTENVASATTWSAGNLYLVSNAISVSAELTIEPGTVIKMAAGASISVSGKITADGTLAGPIVFTSIRDDAHGGDTNGDGDATQPSDRDWNGVVVSADGSLFRNCSFLYAGGGDASALAVEGAVVEVTGAVFAHNKTATDALGAAPALDLSDAAQGTVVQQCLFYDNLVPVVINTAISFDDTSLFDNSDEAPLDPQPNKYNGIFIFLGEDNSDPLPANAGLVEWLSKQVPFVIGRSETACRKLVINAGAMVNFANLDGAGTTVVKLFPGGEIEVKGGLAAVGEANRDVPGLELIRRTVFTSIKDDAHGGDTNGDGDATLPADRDWGGIWSHKIDTAMPATVLYGTEIYYGGEGGRSVLKFEDKSYLRYSLVGHNKTGVKTLLAPPAVDAAHALGMIEKVHFFDNTLPLATSLAWLAAGAAGGQALDNSAVDPENPISNEINAFVVQCGEVKGIYVLSDSPYGPPATWVIGNPRESNCNSITIAKGDPMENPKGINSNINIGSRVDGRELTIKFLPGGYIEAKGNLQGAIANPPLVEGVEFQSLSTRYVTFTSIKDDEHGGDTNADGSLTTPEPGDWEGIRYHANQVWGNTGIIRNTFLYGGKSSTGEPRSVIQFVRDHPEDPALEELATFVVVENVFAHNGVQSGPLSIDSPPVVDLSRAAAEMICPANPRYDATLVFRNRFYDNYMAPLWVNTSFPVGLNYFDNAEAAPSNPQPNSFNAIFVEGSTIALKTGWTQGGAEYDISSGSITWAASKVPYVIGRSDKDLSIAEGASLTLADGAVVKLYPLRKITGPSGALTVGSGNHFTSIKDDTYLGDTNGDGETTIESTDYWDGIYVDDTCQIWDSIEYSSCKSEKLK